MQRAFTLKLEIRQEQKPSAAENATYFQDPVVPSQLRYDLHIPVSPHLTSPEASHHHGMFEPGDFLLHMGLTRNATLPVPNRPPVIPRNARRTVEGIAGRFRAQGGGGPISPCDHPRRIPIITTESNAARFTSKYPEMTWSFYTNRPLKSAREVYDLVVLGVQDGSFK